MEVMIQLINKGGDGLKKNNKTKKAMFSVCLDEDSIIILEREAEKRGQSRSGIAREIILNWLRENYEKSD